MKKSKILVPAVALLALSTAAATTGTVAWFTTNTHVEANSLSMSIQSAKDLRIANGHGDTYTWETKLTWEDKIASAAPCTAIDGSVSDVKALIGSVTEHTMTSTVNFVVPKIGVGANTILADGKAEHKLTAGEDNSTYWESATAGTNYLAKPYSLLYAGTEATATINGSLKVTANAEAVIDKAFRIGYLVDNVFTAYTLSTYSEKVYTVALPTLTLTNNTPKALDIYVWYDGEDGKCINANAIVNTLGVSVLYDVA